MTTINPVGNGLSGTTGTGNFVGSTSPALVTPNIGTPSAGTLTSCTGLPLTTGVTGTLPIGNGGTNVTSVTTTPTSSAFAGWDSNSNLSANNMLEGYTTTAIFGGTTVLTASSTYLQYFTGTNPGTNNVQMANTSTLKLGQSWRIVNAANNPVNVTTSSANIIVTLAVGTECIVTCLSTSGTGFTSSWSYVYSYSAGLVVPVTVAQGGTSQTSLTAYGIVTGGTTSTGAVQQIATATSGYLLQSGGSAALPTFTNTPALGTPASGVLTNCTGLPLTSGVTGNLPVTNLNSGTNASSSSYWRGDGAWVSVKAPTVQQFTSGSGTYTTPTSPKPLYLRVIIIGGGAGGDATGTTPGTAGAGNNTTFGSSLLTAFGGAISGGTPGSGNLGGSPGIALSGGRGSKSSTVTLSNGGNGGETFYGGAGTGGTNGAAGNNATANTGSGGGGAGGGASFGGASGGSSGAYVEGILSSLANTYSYSVGAGGAGATAGTGGTAGGNGAAGIITVFEYYQ